MFRLFIFWIWKISFTFIYFILIFISRFTYMFYFVLFNVKNSEERLVPVGLDLAPFIFPAMRKTNLSRGWKQPWIKEEKGQEVKVEFDWTRKRWGKKNGSSDKNACGTGEQHSVTFEQKRVTYPSRKHCHNTHLKLNDLRRPTKASTYCSCSVFKATVKKITLSKRRKPSIKIVRDGLYAYFFQHPK